MSIYNKFINENDVVNIMHNNHEQIAWDYVLIDEAQDWNDIERDLIYFIFGKEKVVIADGVDQYVRNNKCQWTHGMKKEQQFIKITEKRGVRQKGNLIKFVSQVAERLSIDWNVEPVLHGGKIIIKIGEYTKELHDKVFEKCKQDGNSAYEMMFLVPPCLVKKGNGRCFSKMDEFKKNGITIWDGTNPKIRTEYPTNVNSFRLLQYDSCRGLEGWTVVCLELDNFMEYKETTYVQMDNENELALESPEEKRSKFVNLWTLIPLTRAIDTLIITIKNKNSKIAKILYEINIYS